MSDGPELLEVGRITKPHGLKGEVVVRLSTDRAAERTRPGAELQTGAGRSLVVRAARPHQGRWIVSFQGTSRREDAEALRGQVLLATPLEVADVVFAHQVIGRHLVDQHGTDHGPVVALEANPAADLLVLGGDRLVPRTFLFAGDGDVVQVDVPPGLLD
jgi:16S rRNA processing protein RimM